MLSHRRWDLSVPELKTGVSGGGCVTVEVGEALGLKALGVKMERPGETVREEKRKVFSEKDMLQPQIPVR